MVQARMENSLGQDLSAVRVHTSAEAGRLSDQLQAKAFTTGRDIFFQHGAYEPDTAAGQEVLAHELIHVVQQSSGALDSPGGRMSVNPPGDVFEQQADATARKITDSPKHGANQSWAGEDEGELQTLQRQETDRDAEVQLLQRQDVLDEEDQL
jgi:hypothetical protein